MSRYLPHHIVAGVAALGLAIAAPGASAQTLPLPSDAQYDVAAGKIEHKVSILEVSGTNAIPSRIKTESWLTADRSRTVVTDLRTGRLRAETVATPKEIRVYSAESNTLRIEQRRRPGGPLENSSAFEAAVQKAYLEQGITSVVGEKAVDGRRALIVRSVKGKWRSDVEDSVTTAVVDAETYALYERETVHPNGEFRQVETHDVELLDATPAAVKASMAMKERKSAKIRRKPARKGATARAAQATPLAGLPKPTDEVARVPAGQVEHSVTVTEVSGTKAAPSRERLELWLTRTRARAVITDVATGKVRSELVATPTETRVYDRARNTITITRHRDRKPPFNAATFEAAVQKAYLEQGITRVIGEQVVDGRRALVVESVPGKWRSDEPTSRTTAVIDAETHQLLERTSTAGEPGQFRQTSKVEKLELVPESSAKARLAMKKHAGAKIRRK